MPSHVVDKMLDHGGPRATATAITELGAKLYDLLGNEKQLRQARQRALRFLDAVSGNMDADAENKHLEQSIRDGIVSTRDQVDMMRRQLEELSADHKALNARIQKRQTELERGEKRLASLQTVRPAFMDEYERLERELAEEYEQYMLRYRNLDYLEQQLDAIDVKERAKLEASNQKLKKLQRKLRQQEVDDFRGNERFAEEDSYSSTDSDDSEGNGTISPSTTASEGSSAGRPTPAPRPARPGTSRGRDRGGRVRGRMDYDDDSSSVSESGEFSDSEVSGSDDGSFDDNSDEEGSDLSGSEEDGSDYDM